MSQESSTAPLVTILMPVFNGQTHLAAAIESILKQSYAHFEFLIIDDGSTDQSAHIIATYTDSRIRFLSNWRNLGLVATLNLGIEYSSGKYIARMDADDVSRPNRLAVQVALLEQGAADISGSFFEVITENGDYQRTLSAPLSMDTVIACLANTVPFAHGSVMLRKAFLEQHQLRYEPKSSIEDFDLWIRVFEAGGIFANAPEALYQYREHTHSLSQLKRLAMAKSAKQLRRQFVLRNLLACQAAFKHLLPIKGQLDYRDQLNLICLAYRLAQISGHWTGFFRTLLGLSPKTVAHGFYRLMNA